MYIFYNMLTMLKPPIYTNSSSYLLPPRYFVLAGEVVARRGCLALGLSGTSEKFVSNNKRVVKKPDMFKNVSADFS